MDKGKPLSFLSSLKFIPARPKKGNMAEVEKVAALITILLSL